MYDAIVVGAGVSGLTNALLLARFGQRVAVVERSAQIGALLRGFDRWGVHYDTGFHYAGGMAAGEGVRRFFEFLDLDKQLTIQSLRRDCFDRVISVDNSLQLELPVGAQQFINVLSEEFPQQRQAIKRYVTALLDISDHLPYLNVDTPLSDFSVFSIAHDTSLQDFLASLTSDARLISVLVAHCALHGISAAQVPFRFHASVVGPYLRSASVIEGGGQALICAFEKQLRRFGVDLFCSAEVKSFHVTDKDEVDGVVLDDGQVLKSQVVISTVNPTAVIDCVPQKLLRPIYRKRLRGLHDTASAYLLFAKCSEPVSKLDGSNIYIIDCDRPGFEHFPFDNNMCYLTAAHHAAGSTGTGFMAVAPATMDHFTQWSDTRRGQRPAAYREKKNAIAHELLGSFYSALPEMDGQVERYELATPLTLRDYTGNPSGALYGAQRYVGDYPLQTITRLPGLHLSGQALVAPGVMGTMVSAFYTVGNILGPERLIEELKR